MGNLRPGEHSLCPSSIADSLARNVSSRSTHCLPIEEISRCRYLPLALMVDRIILAILAVSSGRQGGWTFFFPSGLAPNWLNAVVSGTRMLASYDVFWLRAFHGERLWYVCLGVLRVVVIDGDEKLGELWVWRGDMRD
ncbi:hypothetical protein WN48_06470 [Eufriesea mexicana]|uniref:Uncharacterized protein n=1 Tax=Eufriesea mexicana TaxID=516756 RepID=A0A310SJH2_9HYME|nr:hypothetical protein WN48_06470 [Eufriesea mexicana]